MAAKKEPEAKKVEKAPIATDWRDPNFKPAADDEGLEARMWRIAQKQQGK